MKIIRIILLAAAMAVFTLNFLTIDYQDLVAKQSLWAYFRIVLAFVLVLLLVAAIRKDWKKAKQGKRSKEQPR